MAIYNCINQKKRYLNLIIIRLPIPIRKNKSNDWQWF